MFSAHSQLLQRFFDGFGVTQLSPLNDFQSPDHRFQWFFNGLGVIQPLALMIFIGHGPLVQRCDGFDGSLTSIPGHIYQSSVFHFQSWFLSKLNVDNMDSSWVKYFLASMAAPPPQDGSSQGLGQEEEYNLSSTTIPWLDAFTDGT